MEIIVIFICGVFIGTALGAAITGRIWQRYEERKDRKWKSTKAQRRKSMIWSKN